MPTIKTVSVEFQRKYNLGNFNSATLGCTLWADVEEGEDLNQVMHELWGMVKANVGIQAFALLGVPLTADHDLDPQEYFLGLPSQDSSGVNTLDAYTGSMEQEPDERAYDEQVTLDVAASATLPLEQSIQRMDVEQAKKVLTPKGTPFGKLLLSELRQIITILERKATSGLSEHELQMLAAARTLVREAESPF